MVYKSLNIFVYLFTNYIALMKEFQIFIKYPFNFSIWELTTIAINPLVFAAFFYSLVYTLINSFDTF